MPTKHVNCLTAKLVSCLTAKLMNCLTTKLIDHLTAKLVVVNLVKLHLTNEFKMVFFLFVFSQGISCSLAWGFCTHEYLAAKGLFTGHCLAINVTGIKISTG